MIGEILTELREAVSISQCAEDATAEKHIKTALGVVNGTLLNVIIELEYLQTKQQSRTANGGQKTAHGAQDA